MITMLRRRVTRKIWVVRNRQIIYSCIKVKSGLINSSYTMCHLQHLGQYIEGQGHSMTLQQNLVRPITLLFEVGFYNYF